MFKIMISTAGAAYSEDEQITQEGRAELKENLKRIGEEILEGFNYGYIMDINGNKTGSWNLD